MRSSPNRPRRGLTWAGIQPNPMKADEKPDITCTLQAERNASETRQHHVFAPLQNHPRLLDTRRDKRRVAHSERTPGGNFKLPALHLQEAHRHVERSATPALQTVSAPQSYRSRRCYRQDILGTDSRGQQRLVSVTPSRIREQKTLMSPDCSGERLRSILTRSSGVDMRGVLSQSGTLTGV